MPVAQSSHLQNFEYDPATETLVIQFVNGAIYRYDGVGLVEYDNLKNSGSSGVYFWTKIRNRYPTTLITGGSANTNNRGGRR